MGKYTLKNNPAVQYLRDSKEELKKVVWPTKQRVIRDTITVIGISVAIGAFFGILDFGFSTLFQKLIEIR